MKRHVRSKSSARRITAPIVFNAAVLTIVALVGSVVGGQQPLMSGDKTAGENRLASTNEQLRANGCFGKRRSEGTEGPVKPVTAGARARSRRLT